MILVKSGIFLLLAVASFAACNNSQKNYVPQRYQIEIKDMQFQPATLSVHKGDTVTWINKDIVAHNVTQKDSVWASPTLASEASWQKIIEKSDPYYCSIHINMKGELLVE